ncbi:macrolide export ATP-binding/permease protein MacB [mine drainage metagenome]|uniref:Macrolide export ATP-binding/permease protein MacB n=1 Tax=mine drainage metagenome TaxID=410659 RepID=A0A1J5QFI6_9ZZZZ
MLGVMLGEAWHAMSANRMRTFLTMLGMVIGVGAVIAMMAIGQGVKDSVNESIASMGSNLFVVVSGSTTSGGMHMGGGASPTLTWADAQAIAELPSIRASAPVIGGAAQVVHGSANWSTSVSGVTPAYLEVAAWRIAAGGWLSDTDIRSATRVAVLGQTVVQNLFGDEDPLGKTIRIKQSPFTVIGTLEGKGQSLDGRDQDDVILVPLRTAQRQLFAQQFQNSVRNIMVQAVTASAMPQAEKDMNELLRQRHRLRESADNDFTVRNITVLAKAAAQTAQLMSMLLGAIASISLVVGGVGIMNIMLVSVTERTREIGIRMAIGARRRDILMQFLLEAISISVAGCMVGVALGVGAALLVNQLTQTPVVITLSAILMGFAVATAVGIFFGYYPAHQAAKLRPIEALRYN